MEIFFYIIITYLIILISLFKNNKLKLMMNSEEKLNKINENKNNNHYTKEIQQLLDMGFDKEKAIDAIEFTRGNIELAIDYLYNGFPKHDNNNNFFKNISLIFIFI